MTTHFPAEWHHQYAIQLTWPHEDTDWNWILEATHQFYLTLANTILKYENLIICGNNDALANKIRSGLNPSVFKAHIFIAPSNDTWARDHGPISVFEDGQLVIKDFVFNGWGNKFESDLDNKITRQLHQQSAYNADGYESVDLVMEGGSLESDGLGTVLTTSNCLLNTNRNPHLSKADIEQVLTDELGAETILWLEHGHLEGDDTDAHIDTLARLCPNNVVVYQGCRDKTDLHFDELQAMKQELQSFKNNAGQPFTLFELPFPQAVYETEADGSKTRLPATYANFLIINGAVLMPIYNLPQDEEAIEVMQQAMPDHDIVPVDCSLLIRQYGSLHCITMQIPDNTDAL